MRKGCIDPPEDQHYPLLLLLSTAKAMAIFCKLTPGLTVRTLGMGIAAAATIIPLPASAQIVPDTTLGGAASSIAPDSSVQGQLTDVITGGSAHGGNLFHSFLEFNVAEGQRVYFANPTGIDAILSRVTGPDPSTILGTLGVDGAADLFFMNPNGIVFGQNARLDISGGFHATTAAAIALGDEVFSAVAPGQSTLLSVSPSVLLETYLTPTSGDITAQGTLAAGNALTLAARQLDLQGAIAAAADVTLLATDTVTIRDTAEVPFVAFAGDDLQIQGNQLVDIFTLGHPDSGLYAYGDLTLRSANPVGGDAHYQAGGNFRVETLEGQLGQLQSPHDPVIRTLGDVSFESYLGASLHILAGGSVQVPGLIVITGPELGTGIEGTDFIVETVTLSDGETLVDINGAARPTLDIRAGVDPAVVSTPGSPNLPTGSVGFFEPDVLFGFLPVALPSLPVLDPPTADLRADITVGSIAFITATDFLDLLTGFVDPASLPSQLLAGDVLLTNQYQSNPALEGDITVSSTINDLIADLGFGGLLSVPSFTVQTGSIAAGGNLFIDAKNSLSLDGVLNTSAVPNNTGIFSGVGGRIHLLAAADVTLNPGAVLVSAGAPNGRTEIHSGGQLTINDGAIVSLTAGGGEGANLTLTAQQIDLINQDGVGAQTLIDLVGFFGVSSQLQALLEDLEGSSGIVATSFFGGQGGDLVIDTTALQITNNAPPTSTGNAGIATFGPGEVGDLTITADTIAITGNDPEAVFVPEPGRGLAFDIRDIPTGISTANLGSGQGGILTLNTQHLTISNRAGVTAGSVATTSSGGSGGEVRVQGADVIDLSGLAVLATGTLGPGAAGDLIIEDAGSITLRNGATIATDTVGSGDAGNITIEGDRLTVLSGSRIGAATGDQGDGGDITLTFAEQIILAGTSPVSPGEGVSSGLFTDAQGIAPAGNIVVTTPALQLSDGAAISASTIGPGTGGSIQVVADALQLEDSTITASSVGRGDAGDISLHINGPVTLIDSIIAAIAAPDSSLPGFEQGIFAGWATVGDVRIEGTDFGIAAPEGTQQALLTNTLTDNSLPSFELDTFLNLPPGTLSSLNPSSNPISEGAAIKTVFTAEAGEQVAFDWNFVTTEATPSPFFNDFAFVVLTTAETLADTGFPDGSGAGFTAAMADIENTGTLNAVAATGEQTFTAELPAAGTYELGIGVADVGDEQFTSGLLVDAVQLPAGSGSGGNVAIKAQSIDAVRSQITARSSGLGDAGSILLQVEDALTLENTDISTAAEQSTGGAIAVTADTIVLRADSDIRTNVSQGQGGGGDIELAADLILAFADSDILAFSADGAGGDITLNTPAFFGEGFQSSPQLTTQQELEALDGNGLVDINATGSIASGNISLPDVSFIENSLNELSAELVSTEALTAGSCIASASDAQGTFVVTGSEGLPQQPGEQTLSSFATGVVQSLPDVAASTTLQEAQGVYQLADGRLVLSHHCRWSETPAKEQPDL